MSVEEDSSLEEEREEREAGLDGMLSYGEKKSQARFQASVAAKIIQGELGEIAARAGYSIRGLLMSAVGGLDGSDAFHGRSRARLAAQALAFLHGSELDLVTTLVVATLEEDDGDLFCLEPVPGEILLSKRVIDTMHRNDLLTDEVHQTLTDDLDIGSSEFYPGDFVTNKAVVITGHRTATERLEQRRAAQWRIVGPRLPQGVGLVEVIRVDNQDSSLRWRDAFDRTKKGWVEQRGVRKVATTRQSDVGDDDGDSAFSGDEG